MVDRLRRNILSPSIPAPRATGIVLHRMAANWDNFWLPVRHNPFAWLGFGIISLFVLMAISHPVLMATLWDQPTYHPLVGFDYETVPHPNLPSLKHILGTDALGRDIFSQLLFATRTSLALGLVAGILATALSTLVGIISAHFGGKTSTLLMGMSDAFLLMPPPIVLLVIGLLIDMGWLTVGLIFGLFAGLGALAITANSFALSVRVKPYVDAARAVGGSDWYILRVHYLPNMLPLMVVNLMFTITQSVMIEALLSYFGRTQLRMSWGTMIWFTQSMFRLSPTGSQWHAIIPPAIAIMLFCGSFYLVGRAMDEVAEPRLRKR
jgi:peptide/nickel transport system permease protein